MYMNKSIKNSHGEIFYGMHFYPGVAEYSEPGKDAYRIFINEDTIRRMDPTFAGRPIFVEHVDEVEPNLDQLRKEADGWVIESFFNAADGKHWVKFIATTKKAITAIKSGYRLSNAYRPKGPGGPGGLWNGVTYQKEILDGEFEHLAIVRNPRYEESTIFSPEEFKAYNEGKKIELQKLANAKDKGETVMSKMKFWNRKAAEGVDENMIVTLPKSGKEKTLAQLVNDMDDMMMPDMMANGDHHVMVGEEKMKVNDLVKKHMDCMNELSEMKKNRSESEPVLKEGQEQVDVEGDKHNEEDDEAKKKAKELADKESAEKKKNEEEEKKKNEIEKKKQENFDKLKNAHLNDSDEVAHVELMEDQVKRGQARYGSAK